MMSELDRDVSDDPTAAILFALAYEELKRLARHARRHRHAAETMDTTALVHEVFLKIHDREEAREKDPAYLRALAARAMRQILVDRARRRLADKRNAGVACVTLHGIAEVETSATPFDIVKADRALSDLEKLDARLARLVELHVFAGMSMPEVARALDINERTAFRDWRKARAFLVQHLEAGNEPASGSGSMRTAL